jgi:hypothetical protein
MEPAIPEPAAPPRHPRWRRVLVIVCLVLGGIGVPASALAVWVNGQVLSTDGYIETVAPLSDDPAVTGFVAERLTGRLTGRLDAPGLAERLLPERASALAAPIGAAINGYIGDVTERFVESSLFDRLWLQANRFAHAQLLAAILDRGGAVPSEVLSFDTAVAVQELRRQLAAQGVNVPAIQIADARIQLFDASTLVQLRAVVDLFDRLAIALPILTVALFAAAIALARDRRRAVWWVGAVLVVSLIVMGVALNLARSAYLNSVNPQNISEAAAAAVWDQLLRYLKLSLRTGIAVGLVLMIGAAVFGPSRAAVWLRAVFTGLGDRAAERAPQGGRVGELVAQWRSFLVAGGVAVAALVFVLWDNPSPWSVFAILIVLLAWIAVVTVVARAAGVPRRPAPG